MIYTIIMMNNNFIAGNANLDNPDEEIGTINIPSKRIDNVNLDYCISNSFGFGGTNSCIAIGKDFEQ